MYSEHDNESSLISTYREYETKHMIGKVLMRARDEEFVIKAMDWIEINSERYEDTYSAGEQFDQAIEMINEKSEYAEFMNRLYQAFTVALKQNAIETFEEFRAVNTICQNCIIAEKERFDTPTIQPVRIFETASSNKNEKNSSCTLL
ncbi:MAG: hypothetical protein EP298_01380 [Gammaproteobacteria bacterium]|nr:MAG: hypothetical protein EP298_01380 [Gammaproteobacteria bacterium]UTW42002.1 hypothetical protein KFE69_10890 [bacterium SCSIO 12844]